jgi:hypothetical protein
MPEAQSPSAKPGKPKYLTVVEGFALANDLVKSRQTVAEFARQRGVTTRMVQYWAGRARELAEKNTPNLVQVAEISQSGVMVPVSPPAQLPATLRPQLAAVISAQLTSPLPVIEVQLKNGIRIGIGAGFSPEVLKQVISCLGGTLC